ncbi:AAA family ATPase [Fontivita pretiosa]|uniref:cytidylate kinase-like family protein n=1 Tax=Fontivita pretiosa TaxID=2989684 RepID=UPI003D185B53
MPREVLIEEHVRPILGALRSVPVPAKTVTDVTEPPPPPEPFITISRQPGAGALTLAHQLADALNAELPGDRPWTCWDRELIEKVAADLRLSARLIDELEDRGHSWIRDFLESLSLSDEVRHADDAKIYARVVQTIRALAQAGRVIIVGRGGVFITRNMPGGIHLRLVAPLEKRIEFIARQYQLTTEQAAERIRELERNRILFYRHFWPGLTLSPETFTLTINTAAVEMPAMVQMLVTLVKHSVPARRSP